MIQSEINPLFIQIENENLFIELYNRFNSKSQKSEDIRPILD